MPLPTTQNLSLNKSQTKTTSTSDDSFDALEKKVLYPVGINQKFDLWFDHVRGVPEDEKIFFTQNLAAMFKSGLSAARALKTLALQADNPKFKRALFKIYRNVEKGERIADSMAKYPKIFTPIFTNMVRAGESSGQLEEVLRELTRQLKRSHELKAKIKGALMYPMAILIAMVLIGSGMIIFVIPKLIGIFTEMNVDLPLATRMLIGLSGFVNNYIYIVAPAVILTVFGTFYYTRKGIGQKIWHKIILSFPVIKTISQKINLAKISRTLSSLLETDMPIVDSFNLTSNVISNIYYKESLNAIAKNVEKGQSIASQMKSYENLYPPVIQQMIMIGEETGEISSILNQLAEFYEEDVSQTMDSLPSLIEPILIVVLGAAVGGMAIAIILPMFSLSAAG
jgi:type IV pilus assembly protein PilC